jgi:hypothetical protein
VTNDADSNDVKNLWQNQPSELLRISPEEFLRKMNEFRQRTLWRNVREYAGGAVVLAVFGCYEWASPELFVRVASGLIIAGTLYVMYQLHRRASTRPGPADLGLRTCIEFHRNSLERQRDALRTVWSWYLLPFVPGLAVLVIGSIAKNYWATHGHLAISSFVSPGIVAGVFFTIWKLNRSAARRLKTQIDELDRTDRR